MRHENSKYLFNYWDSLRAGRPAPDRREIEPSDIRNVLGDTFILELDEKFKTLSFRLAGTRLCNAHGFELKGYGFLSLWEEADNLNVYRTVRSVFEDASPCVLSYLAVSQNMRFIECEMLLLPLLNGFDHASRVLGIVSMSDKPTWLGTDPIEVNRLKMARVVDLADTTEAIFDTPNLDPRVEIESQNLKRVGHLTIIDGGMD
ncbi:MAG: PAS domain-containing protein [Pseudomonadota bacterium]